ncbi:MAG TPA: sigma-70 family RNA polymerase sigma factor, partial [Candidatus Saccharimonadales bacterium]|nr:sigma-70 family RNA polymerase sigma factor [Candidatus Saccharimonadales bacterium]
LDQERALILTRKIGELNPRQRMAITLRYFRQMPLKEIADVLQCSEGNVKNMLFRSVRKLRDSLAGSGLEEWT